MRITRRKIVDWECAQIKAANTPRWAVTMAKVRIRRVASRTRWQLVTFCGKAGGESIGVIDMMAVRKDHGTPMEGGQFSNHPYPSKGRKRGNANQVGRQSSPRGGETTPR